MLDSEVKNIYVLQSRNVRYLKKVEKTLKRDINECLLKNDDFQLKIKTKYYALLYSLISESQFVQILHTPHGFKHSEILKIQKERSLIDQWHTMIDIAIKRVGNPSKNKDLQKKHDQIKKYLDEYIKKPQELRNKIAHGQWIHTLNSENTKENKDTTKKINELDFVTIQIWFEVHQYLCFIVRDLIQSPKNTFHCNYWLYLTKLEEFLKRSKCWSVEGKRVELKKRKQKYENTI